jgi:hypothetical protein
MITHKNQIGSIKLDQTKFINLKANGKAMERFILNSQPTFHHQHYVNVEKKAHRNPLPIKSSESQLKCQQSISKHFSRLRRK